MSTISRYPSKRPSVKSVSYWDNIYEESIDSTWAGYGRRTAKVERGEPFPDFYRVTYTIDGAKKSKLFYGESAWNEAERFVYDLGFYNVLGRI